jgi:hypothetical protein
MNGRTYYEDLGVRYMEEYDDLMAERCLEYAIALGSEKAKSLLQYLKFGVSEEDYSQETAEISDFDYELAKLRSVSRMKVEAGRLSRKISWEIDYLIDCAQGAAEAFLLRVHRGQMA